MKIKRHQVIIAALIILGVSFLVIGVFHQKEPIKYFAHSLRTWQEADSVAGYPIPTAYDEEGSPTEFKITKFQPNLSTMSPMELYRLPTARGFTNLDSNDAKAAGTGLVLFTGNPNGYNGKAVLLGHRLPNKSIVQTFYTGLSEIDVKVGQHVPRATTLGTGGQLLEVRAGSSIDIAKETFGDVTMNSQDKPPAPNRIALAEFFSEYQLKETVADPLEVIQQNGLEKARNELDIGVRFRNKASDRQKGAVKD
ncbi:MAG: M23 family metallopeptidase [Verrucomicrobia bacterium]|nr:M23 family metallopeptidase [Verrucomicrobiota bacterium]